MKFIVTAALLIASAPAFAEKSAPVQGKLDNGLKYTVLPLHAEKGRLEIRMRVNVGSVDENDDQAGAAHMIGRLVFRGTRSHPNGLMPYLHEQKWARGKNYSAVATYDDTAYTMVPPATSGLSQSLDALSQMLFGAKLTQADLDDERKIVLEERHQSLGAGAAINEQRTASVRVDSRYARHPVTGSEESISGISSAQLQQFYQTWYVPNNMNLLIVGDVKPDAAKAEIQRYFGGYEFQDLPKRDYLEPKLADRLQIDHLQDPHGNISRVAYILRFDESKSRGTAETARFERLVDRLTLSALLRRLHNQAESLSKGVSSITARKSDIGRNTTALGIFATVEANAHQSGLKQILTEIERLKHFPITEEELAKHKAALSVQIEKAKRHDGDRDFAAWVEVMAKTVLTDKPFLTQPELAARAEPLLKKITAAEINDRLQAWLGASDRIVQYQPSGQTKVSPMSGKTVAALQEEIASLQIAEPQKEKEIMPMSLEALESKGTIVREQHFAAQNVTYWTLSNGDKVVWLKSDKAKNKTYFQSLSSAGFKAEGLSAWQSQLASQLIAQNAPLDWEIEQLNRWKEQHKINLSIKQNAAKLRFEGVVENTGLADLLRLFYAYQAETAVKSGLGETKENIAQMLDLQNEKNDENERIGAIAKLRYNLEGIDDTLPNPEALAKLTEKDLNGQWAKMVKAPTTYFFVNNLSEEEMKPLLTRFLADLPRDKRLNSTQILPVGGKAESRMELNSETKADIRIWTFMPYRWQGRDAVSVSLLRNIAVNKLKQTLRDEQLGVYGLRFESMLNPNTQRLESELAFTANPTDVDKLVERVRAVLTDLPDRISEEDVKAAGNQFVAAEKERLNDPKTWLARLILSENQFGTSQYLSEMQHLSDAITLENLKIMAANLYNAESEKIFIALPKK